MNVKKLIAELNKEDSHGEVTATDGIYIYHVVDFKNGEIIFEPAIDRTTIKKDNSIK